MALHRRAIVRFVEFNASRLENMSSIKSVIKSALGETFLIHWRRFYWWNKSRINPAKNKRIIRSFLKERSVINLELGTSKRPEMVGWIASDINGNGDLKLDFTKPIPFPDESVDRIYSSHVLEHFSYPNPMLTFLSECHRILKKGGEFSIAVPDAELFLKGYFDPENFDKDALCAWDTGLNYSSPIDYVNFIAYLGGEHKHLFDRQNLNDILEEVGFKQVSARKFDPSIDLKYREYGSIYAIGLK